MLFNSLQYMIFFPLVVGLFYLIPRQYRWILLLAASYFFYMSWKVEYIFLIIASTLVDYVSGGGGVLFLADERSPLRYELSFKLLEEIVSLAQRF